MRLIPLAFRQLLGDSLVFATQIRFMFARHSEFMKYQFDIVRKNVGETEAAREAPEAASSRQPPAPPTDDIQAGAPLDPRV